MKQSALGVALAPALWSFDRLASWSASLPGPVHWFVLGTGAALCFFMAGLALLGLPLGALAPRGETNLLTVPLSKLMRLRYNPFFAYVEKRVAEVIEQLVENMP